MFPLRHFIFFGLSFSLSVDALAAAGSAWASGVSQEKGWIDANKTMEKGSSMCWAATSANMLQYWQNAYVAAGNALPGEAPHGYTIGSEISTGSQSQIFDYFLNNWTDFGGAAEYGVPWYLTGGFFDSYPTGSSWSQRIEGSTGNGGLFKDVYASAWNLKNSGDFKRYWASYRNNSQEFMNLEGFSALLIDSFVNQQAVVGLNIDITKEIGTRYRHAITLWGCDFDEKGLVTKIYFTDSDDNETLLDSATIHNGSGGVFLSDYDFGKTVKIHDMVMLSVKRFPPIPEPSAFGLFAGLGAIALVAFRRQRK